MIVVDQLSKQFPGAAEDLFAVRDLSFRVKESEVYGLLGPNGAGKTTTLRMILGLLTPTSGNVLVGGHSVTDAPDEVKRRIGFVAAGVGVYPWLTPREVLSFIADMYSVAPDQAAAATAELSRLLQLETFLDQRCGTLSTGQKQRVNLARALIHDPPVMLLDEPTRGLDVVGTQVVFDYISHLRGLGKSVIVCTHRLDEAERICSRLGLLHLGSMRHEGTLQQLQEKTGRRTLTEMFLDLLDASRPAAATLSGGRPVSDGVDGAGS